jgi:hypothetical protein
VPWKTPRQQSVSEWEIEVCSMNSYFSVSFNHPMNFEVYSTVDEQTKKAKHPKKSKNNNFCIQRKVRMRTFQKIWIQFLWNMVMCWYDRQGVMNNTCMPPVLPNII